MNYLNNNLEFTTFEEGLEKLKDAVSIRDKMSGSLYWNILNEDCCEIANEIRKNHGRREEIGEILGEGNFV